jgi:3,4-dihydroxy 2-butanone 4-phosphate synthase/GTP cyclohydrolase II
MAGPSAVAEASLAEATFDSVDQAVAALFEGRMVIVVDGAERENEGDLVVAAEHATPEAINFMATHGRGLICVPMGAERLRALAIPPMVAENTDRSGTAFHVGVDHRCLATTGISAADRAAVIRALADPAARPEDFTRPGHVFPLAARAGGVLRRAGHTEAAIDLCRLAGLRPAAAICEIADDDGEMARLPSLRRLARAHRLPLIAISDLIALLMRRERHVERVSSARLPLDQGEFTVIAYRDAIEGRDHLAVVMGDVAGAEDALVRVHSECLTGDVLGSRRCDCGRQLEAALAAIAAEGRGALVYLRGHEGRGIGLAEKVHAYALQDRGADTVEANLALGYAADRRDYGLGAQIIRDLGIRRLRLLTNNPAKRAGLEGYGLTVVDRVPLLPPATPESVAYLDAKAAKLGHLLDLEPGA